MELKTELKKLADESSLALKKAKGKEGLENFRIAYLGRKGALTGILRKMKNLSLEEKRTVGRQANELKKQLEGRLKEKLLQCKE